MSTSVVGGVGTLQVAGNGTKTVVVTASLARPWLASRGGLEGSWRFDPKVAGGGILTDAGVDNDASLPLLARAAVCYARAGAEHCDSAR